MSGPFRLNVHGLFAVDLNAVFTDGNREVGFICLALHQKITKSKDCDDQRPDDKIEAFTSA